MNVTKKEKLRRKKAALYQYYLSVDITDYTENDVEIFNLLSDEQK